MGKKLTIQRFIEKANTIHGDKYNYSKVNYINNRTKVCIICPEHGEFWQTPKDHLNNRGCLKCYENRRGRSITKTVEYFIKEGRLIHGDKYDYSKVNYVNNYTKVCIICPEHGEFWQTPKDHLNSHGCPNCYKNRQHSFLVFSQKTFLQRSEEIHESKYDYSNSIYINQYTPIIINCPIHGNFKQTPKRHWKGEGCPKCANNVKLTTKEWIEKAKKMHGDKYDYSKVNYINAITKVHIICPEHGEFLQIANDHLQGHGCLICNSSKIENKIYNLLKSKKIINIKEWYDVWLKYKNPIPLDFYLPEYNIGIECQGIQHFIPISYFGGVKSYNENVERDKTKFELCKKNGIDILYFSEKNIYLPENYFSEIYTDTNELLNKIYEYKRK